MLRLDIPLLATALLAAGPAAAQLIPVRTVPVAAGDQFLVSPSQNLGMGSVSIAVADTLLDPFVNPALGARVRETLLFGAPALYRISSGNGGAQTLPVGVLATGGAWYAGASLALQEVKAGEGAETPIFWDVPQGQTRILGIDSGRNVYLSGLLGMRLRGGLSIGWGASYAGLNMVDGVDMLYAGSQRIEQDGRQLDLRLGAALERPDGQEVELVVARNRFEATHDVTYLDVRWDSLARRVVARSRVEHNKDETASWGAHLTYLRPLTERGWRVGWSATANYKDHPKIPNYEIMNIPRDPGKSWAYELGVGLARVDGPTRIAMDAVYQPIWTESWADADTAVTSAVTRRRIAPGERTIENDFEFSNYALRLGLAQRVNDRFGFQLGLQLRSVAYELEQRDLVAETDRDQEESWMEWVPTWGISAGFSELNLRYAGRVTTGTGRPGVAWSGRETGVMDSAALSPDFIVAPSGPLTLQDVSVATHQITASFPIR